MSSRSVLAVAIVAVAVALAAPRAAAEPLRPTGSIAAGPALALGDEVGAAVIARGGAGRPVAERTSLAAFVEASATRWRDATDAAASFGWAVRVRITPRVSLEPAIALGLEGLDGRRDEVMATYGSTVALVAGGVRLGVQSRLYFTDDRRTQLFGFLGWQIG